MTAPARLRMSRTALLPIVLFFGIGASSAVVCTLVYAMPPIIRIAGHGIRNVPETTLERPDDDLVRLRLLRQVRHLEAGKIEFHHIPPGNEISDTYFALKETLKELLKKNILPIIIGGSKDLAFYNYLAYEELEQTVNLVSIEPSFSIGNNEEELSSSNYLSKIILHQPNFLFNYSNIGYQSYFTDPKEVHLLDELFFDSYRLGFIKKDIRETEPVIRNADILVFDMAAIKQTDAPANLRPMPNGILSDEACQLCRYAGMSDKLSSAGFYEMNPTVEDHGQTASLLSQMIWYFIDGFYNRKKDFPACNKTEYKKYTVASEEGEEAVSFYKSGKSDRWWMDVPYNSGQSSKYKRHLMVPCSYKDYETAMNYEIPDRWFQTLKKLKDS